jgi:hypothetical protein
VDDTLAQWLALREAVDWASRSLTLTQQIADRLSTFDPLCVLDLATGTGSNIRYLMDRLPHTHQRWLAIDRSDVLLDRMRQLTSLARPSDNRVHLDSRRLDLAVLDAAIFSGQHLVTASALLDLVSASWLESLAAHCRRVGAIALFAITYNGASRCSPGEPEDDAVLELFNRHQHRDKGLGGPAAGPDATAAARDAFGRVGYHVETAPSDWILGPEHAALQRELIDGWAFAATQTDASASPMIEAWRRRRLEHVDAGRSHIVVGHYDLAAW